MKSAFGRAKCPLCGREFEVNARGGVRDHRNADRSPGAPWSCPLRAAFIGPVAARCGIHGFHSNDTSCPICTGVARCGDDE